MKKLFVGVILISIFVLAGFALAENGQAESFPETAEFVSGGIGMVEQAGWASKVDGQNETTQYAVGYPDVYVTDNSGSMVAEEVGFANIPQSEHYTMVRADFQY